MNVITSLWHGNITPQEDGKNNSDAMKKVIRDMAKYHEVLHEGMTEEQQEILEKFDDVWSDYTSLSEETIFCYAFKLGAMLMLEILINPK